MKRRLLRTVLAVAVLLPLLFLGRLVMGFLGTASSSIGSDSGLLASDVWSSTRKNYASMKLDKGGGQQAGAPRAVAVDQKYEKVAALRSETHAFERDEAAVRSSIQRHGALVQLEQSRGLAGHRALLLSIGVPPERFEAMLDEVRRIGALRAVQVDKTDKTNEYRDLQAHRASLEKARADLMALKDKAAGARIDEQINLANRVLEIEGEIQKLGVRLGEFDAENEFVTIRFSLEETRAPARISIAHRIKVATVWSLQAYAAALGLVFFSALTALLVLAVLDRLRWIPEAIKKQVQ